VGARVLHHHRRRPTSTTNVNLCIDNFKVRATEAKVRLCNADTECGFDYVATWPATPATGRVTASPCSSLGGGPPTTVASSSDALRHLRAQAQDGVWKVRPVRPVDRLRSGVTRVGAFLNGCCFGKDPHVPWAVASRWAPAWGGAARRPSDRRPAAALSGYPRNLLALAQPADLRVLYFVFAAVSVATDNLCLAC